MSGRSAQERADTDLVRPNVLMTASGSEGPMECAECAPEEQSKDEIDIQAEEAQGPKGITDPGQPTKRKIDEHELTHVHTQVCGNLYLRDNLRTCSHTFDG